MLEIPQYVQSLIASQNVVKAARVEMIQKTVDRSMIPVNIVLSNIGNNVLEDFKFEIKSRVDGVTFADSNTKHNLLNSLDFVGSNRSVVENRVKCSNLRVLPIEEIKIDTFYVAVPANMKEIVLEWIVTTASRDNNKSGKLVVKVSPCFDTQYLYSNEKAGQDFYEPYITNNDEE